MIPNILAVNVFRRENNLVRVAVALGDREQSLSLRATKDLSSKRLETIVDAAVVGVLGASGETSAMIRFQFYSPFCLGLIMVDSGLFSFHQPCQG